jgi:hypothetical protein
MKTKTQPLLQTLMDVLIESEIALPRPKSLSETDLTAKLWQVISALLAKSIVVCNTDHLSDRELYSLLWNETLRQQVVLAPQSTLYIDMTRTGIDDGMAIYLKYYATEDQRQLYADAYPEFEMPVYTEPPPRRDHLIPDVRGARVQSN